MSLVPDLKALSKVTVAVNGQTSPSSLPSQFHRLSVWVMEAPGFLLCCFSNVFHVFSWYILLDFYVNSLIYLHASYIDLVLYL